MKEQSNRVIRRYPGAHSNFVRVSFTEEGGGHSRLNFEVDMDAFTEARVGQFLKNGKCHATSLRIINSDITQVFKSVTEYTPYLGTVYRVRTKV